MSLLRATRCAHCGNQIEVPLTGNYRIQCGQCNQVNIPRAPFYAQRSVAHVPPYASATTQQTKKPTVEALPLEETPPQAPEPVEQKAPQRRDFPVWSAKMKKDALLDIAGGLGLDVTTKDTKKGIMQALKAAQAAHES